MVVKPRVEVKVEESDVSTETMAEVVMADEDAPDTAPEVVVTVPVAEVMVVKPVEVVTLPVPVAAAPPVAEAQYDWP